jgi:hypothetical protein
MKLEFGTFSVEIVSPELDTELAKMATQVTQAVEAVNKAVEELIEIGNAQSSSQDENQAQEAPGPTEIPITEEKSEPIPQQRPQQNQKPTFGNVPQATENFAKTMQQIEDAGGIEALQAKASQAKAKVYEFKVILNSGNSVEFDGVRIDGKIPPYINDQKYVSTCFYNGNEVTYQVFREKWLQRAAEILRDAY